MPRNPDQYRQTLLSETLQSYGIKEITDLDIFQNETGYTEALHATMIMQSNIEEFLVQDVRILLDEKSFNLARRASRLLADLYRRLAELRYESTQTDI